MNAGFELGCRNIGRCEMQMQRCIKYLKIVYSDWRCLKTAHLRFLAFSSNVDFDRDFLFAEMTGVSASYLCEAKRQSFYRDCLRPGCWSSSCCVESEGTSSISAVLSCAWSPSITKAVTVTVSHCFPLSLCWNIYWNCWYQNTKNQENGWGGAINICEALGISIAKGSSCKTGAK